MSKSKKIILFIEYYCYYLLAGFICHFKSFKEIWLFSERGYEARDNAYHLYKYVRKNEPTRKCYYIIDYESPDCVKIKNIGNTIQYGSFKHKILFFLDTTKISTHVFGCSPNMYFFLWARGRFFTRLQGKQMFLQHGIIKDDFKAMYAKNNKLDLFICGGYLEYIDIKNRYGYKDGVVRYTGLARYDNLVKGTRTKTKTILLMPTWRTYLSGMSDSEFVMTDYFKMYQSFISSNELLKILNEKNYRLLFYPHYEIQKYLYDFSSMSERVVLSSFKNSDVQDLLIHSDILITDYSSVFFDFAYMEKPVIYYQPDYSYFRAHHYNEGYFLYEKHGFGPIANDVNELCQLLDECINHNCEMSAFYKNRLDLFFKYKDNCNCKRNYEAICEQLKG